MKSKTKYAFQIIILIIIMLSENSFAQWQASTGLDGGRLDYLVGIDTMLFAIAGNQGLFVKSNNGNWEKSGPDDSYRILHKANKCLFYYSDFSGEAVYRSFDCGNTWESVPGLFGKNHLLSIDTVLFYSGGEGIVKSFDYGSTYELINLPDTIFIEEISTFDSILFIVGKPDASAYEYLILFSYDLGESWEEINVNGLFNCPSIFRLNFRNIHNKLWAFYTEGSVPYAASRILAFDDNMQIWNDVSGNLPLYSGIYDLIEYKGQVLCSINSYGVFRYNFDINNWEAFDNGSKNVREFLIHNNELLCATDQGACVLDSLGNWTGNYYQGLDRRNITSFSILNDTIYVTASNELFYSTDIGESFSQINNAWGKQIIATDSVFYMIDDHNFKMSYDRGNTWTSYSDSIEHVLNQRINHLCISETAYYLASKHGLFKSPVDSICWTKYGHGYIGPDYYVVGVEAMNRTVFVYAGTSYWNPELYFSNDFGQNFYYYDEALALRRVGQQYCVVNDSLCFSNYLAQEWEKIPYTSRQPIYSIDRRGDTVCYGGYSETLRITFNKGLNWLDIRDNLPMLDFYGINQRHVTKFLDNRILVSNPNNALWYRDDLITATPSQPAPNYNKLEVKAYPNPCSDQLSFHFNSPEMSTLKLNFYNTTGDKIYTFKKKDIPEGKNEIKLELDHWAEGLYIYHAQINKQINSGKIIIKK